MSVNIKCPLISRVRKRLLEVPPSDQVTCTSAIEWKRDVRMVTSPYARHVQSGGSRHSSAVACFLPRLSLSGRKDCLLSIKGGGGGWGDFQIQKPFLKFLQDLKLLLKMSAKDARYVSYLRELLGQHIHQAKRRSYLQPN